MKILMITHLVPFPLHGGVRLRNFNLLKEASRRHEIHLLTFSQKAHQPDAETLRTSIDAIRPFCKHLEVFEIPTDRSRWRWYVMLLTNLFSTAPYSAWRYTSPAIRKAVRRLTQEHRFDLVECGTVALAPLAGQTGDTPKLLVHHNIESELLYRRARYTKGPANRLYIRLQAWKLRRLERKAAGRFVRHTTCSQEDARLLTTFAPDAQVIVVPNGVDTSYFKPMNIPQEPNRIVFVGSMGWFPNLDGMLFFKNEVWPLIKRQVPDVTADIIGTEPGPELVRFSRQDANFRLLGFVDDIRPVVARANVFVVPLRVGGGTRLKIVEAMAMGKVIVSTSTGCEGISVTNGKDIVVADQPAAMASQIVRLLGDAGARARLQDHALRTVMEHYRWERIGMQLEQAYKETMTARPLPAKAP